MTSGARHTREARGPGSTMGPRILGRTPEEVNAARPALGTLARVVHADRRTRRATTAPVRVAATAKRGGAPYPSRSSVHRSHSP